MFLHVWLLIAIVLINVWLTTGDLTTETPNYDLIPAESKNIDINQMFQKYAYYSKNEYSCDCIDISLCPLAMSLLARNPSVYVMNHIQKFTCRKDTLRHHICCNLFVSSALMKRKQKRAYYPRNYGWHHQEENDLDVRNRHDFSWDRNFFPHWNNAPQNNNNNDWHSSSGNHHNKWHKPEDDCKHEEEDWNNNRRRTTTPNPWRRRTTRRTTTTTTVPPPIEDILPIVDPIPDPMPDPPPMAEPPPVVNDTPTSISTNINLDTAVTREAKRTVLTDQSCGISVQRRIVGGEDAALGDYPWMARLGYTRSGTPRPLFRCGGSLISERHVLTAAHCITNLPNQLQLVMIRLGELDERTDVDCSGESCADVPQDFSPERTSVHPNYNVPRLSNDIGVIRLNSTVRLTRYVNPLCLPFLGTFQNLTGIQAIVAGWGATNTGLTAGSPTLKWVRLTIIQNEQCMATYGTRYNISITVNQICTAGVENMDACEGDSGGPLFVEGDEVRRATLIGIVSFGPRRCGTASLPGVYTRVQPYIDWILDSI